jgi:hypothetical protein
MTLTLDNLINIQPGTMTILCHDYSGSTDARYNLHNHKYHDLANKIYQKIRVHPHKIVLWNNTFREIMDGYYEQILAQKIGDGGTLTSQIANYFKNNLSKLQMPINIIILTDGAVDTSDINVCDNIMNNLLGSNLNINSVTAFLVAPQVNASVLAPFIRGDWTSNVYHYSILNAYSSRYYSQTIQTLTDSTITLTSVHTVDKIERERIFNILKTATTQDEINSVFDKLVDILTAMTMGKTHGDPDLRNDILKLLDRIKKNMRDNLSQAQPLTDYITNLNINHIVTQEDLIRVNNAYYDNLDGGDFQKKINQLLLICDGKLSHLFDPQQVGQQMIQRTSIPTTQITDTQLDTISTTPVVEVTPVQCPVTLDDDTQNVCVFIETGTPILDLSDKKLLDDIIKNTFIGYKLSDNIKKRMGHFISVEAYCYMKPTFNPLNKQPILVSLVLGTDDKSVQATNYALSMLLTGKNSMIGNADIWFYIIYKMIKNGHIPWLTDVLSMFERQLIYRLNHSQSILSMSGLANFNQLKAPLGVCLYYVLSQPLFVKNIENNSYPSFASATQDMLDLINLLGYTLPSPNLVKYFKAMKYLSILVNDCKSLHYNQYRHKYDCLRYNHKIINLDTLTPAYRDYILTNNHYHTWIIFDGVNTQPINIDYIQTGDESLVYNLSQLITNESVKAFSFGLDIHHIDKYYDDIPTEVYQEWPLLAQYNTDKPNIVICPKTMRPYTYINNTHWKDVYITKYNPDHKFDDTSIFNNTQDRAPSHLVFCGDKYYLEFVETFGFYPNINDYITFSFNRIMNNKFKLKSLPLTQYDNIVGRYNIVIQDINPVDFNSIAKSSRDREKRIIMEMK